MSPNKYADLNPLAKQQSSQANASSPVAQNMTADSSPPPKSTAPILLSSKEHISPIMALVTYETNSENDTLVRIYDNVVAKRDDAFLVERKELIGKTPEAIQAHFGLTFIPRFLCDALIPIGQRVTMGKVTNAHGKRVSIYKALTALSLSSERPLTQENILPVRLKPSSAPKAKPVVPTQTVLSVTPTSPEMFSEAEASEYLRQFLSPGKPVMPLPDSMKMTGPDGFPYIACNMNEELGAENVNNDHKLSDDDKLRANFVQSLLYEGCGLALWRSKEKNPTWVYRYRDLLCFRLFGSLQPPPEFDERLYAETFDKPLPPGSRVMSGRPSDQLFPDYVHNILNQRLSVALGRKISINPQLIQYPDLDNLRRFKLNLPFQTFSDQDRKKASSEIFWCLPYVTYH